MSGWVLFFRVARNRSILLAAGRLALVVGLVLNLINQGDAIFSGNFVQVHWMKFGLTFCVPFCVSVYSATKAKMSFDPGTRAWVDAHLRCKSCNGNDQEVRHGEIIPECPKCGQKTRWEIVSR